MADGWRAYLGVSETNDKEPETFVFCPECASREFGQAAVESDSY
jgi:hypothetical protein